MAPVTTSAILGIMKRLQRSALAASSLIVAGTLIIALTHQSKSQPEPSQATAHDQTKDELLRDYQTALTAANKVIEDMNLDITTAQQIEALDELELYVDTIPARDTIAHPQLP